MKVDKAWIQSKIEEKNRKYFCSNDEYDLIPRDPLSLLCSSRFGLVAKFLYAKAKIEAWKLDWPRRLYLWSIAAFNGFDENSYPVKNTPDSFVRSFNSTLRSIAEHGFDCNNSLVSVDLHGRPINGEHRIACCYALGMDVTTIKSPQSFDDVFGGQYFKSGSKHLPFGLGEKYCDAIALEYAELKRSTRVIILYPALDPEFDEKVFPILGELGEIVYQKEIQLIDDGQIHFIRHVYDKEPWIGEAIQKFPGAKVKANACFPNSNPVRTLLLDLYPEVDHVKINECKKRIRNICRQDNHSIHINDTHRETKLISRLIFHRQSLRFINSIVMDPCTNFWNMFRSLKDHLEQVQATSNSFDERDLCIDGSSVMAAYGIRDSNDLDYLYRKSNEDIVPIQGINNHNSSLNYYKHSLDEIILDPENHFYYLGLKFTTIALLEDMKNSRMEWPKDYIDIDLLERVTSFQTIERHVAPQMFRHYELGDVLHFSAKEVSCFRHFLRTGWGVPEDELTWIDGTHAEILLRIEGIGNDLNLTVNVIPFVTDLTPIQSLKIFVNGERIASFDICSQTSISATISKKVARLNPSMLIRFEVPNAVSPSTLGISQDKRVLSIAVLSLVLQ